MGTMALGGLFLHTPNPPSNGSTLELLFDVATGTEVRARAVVRNSMPGKGMGVKFVHMRAEDRSRLNQFLKVQLEAGNIQEDRPPGKGKSPVAESRPSESSAGPPPPADSTVSPEHPAAAEPADLQNAAPAEESTGQDDSISEEELRRYVALSEKSNYYQLLGVTADSGKGEIKEGFYNLARKFHPDRHMGKSEWAGPLQKLMGAITEAYNVLSDEKKRGSYDRKLTLSRSRSEAEETIEECARLASNCQRDENFAGAIFWLRKCVNLAPEVAKYRVALAASLAALAHHRREAVQHFEKAIELDPWNAGAYLKFGELYEAMQLPWRAQPLYSKVLEIEPAHPLAKQRLARINLAEKKKAAPKIARLFSKKS